MTTTVRRLSFTTLGLGLAAALAACQGAGQATSPIAPQGLEGQWVSADGVAVSTFQGGTFSTRATDTGNTLADGSYTMVDARNVAITVVSKIPGRGASAVNCVLVSASQLNCTSSTGQNFVLTRRTA